MSLHIMWWWWWWWCFCCGWSLFFPKMWTGLQWKLYAYCQYLWNMRADWNSGFMSKMLLFWYRFSDHILKVRDMELDLFSKIWQVLIRKHTSFSSEMTLAKEFSLSLLNVIVLLTKHKERFKQENMIHWRDLHALNAWMSYEVLTISRVM